MSDRLHAVRLDGEEFGPDPVAVVRGRRRRIMWTLAALVLGAGAVAWPIADRPLRLKLQSAAMSPLEAARAASQDEIDRLRREVDALASEISELKQAQQQAAETIAALRAAEQEARKQGPVAEPPQAGVVPTPPPRPPTAPRPAPLSLPGPQ
jgi:TolA-binding protein